MKKMRFLPVIALSVSLLLGGCQSSENPTVTYTEPETNTPINDHTMITDDSAVFVYRNGRVRSQDVESFGEEYYDVNELKSEYIDPAVSEYNSAAGKDKVKVVSLDLKNGNASLVIDYASTKDFLDFNKNTNLYFKDWKTFDTCPYLKISESGYALPANLVDPSGNLVPASGIKSDTELYLCVLDLGAGYPTGFSGKLLFEGDIAYVSGGITFDSSNGITLADVAGLQYIIFK